MLKCRDVPAQADALLERELRGRARLALQLHLFLCVHCRRYLRQLRLLTQALIARDVSISDAEADTVVKHTTAAHKANE